MLTAGVDVGSTSAKAVLFDGRLKAYAVRPTGWNPREAGACVLAEALSRSGFARSDVACIVATGYGRGILPDADRTVTEITCQARGIHYLTGRGGTIIDIGGQDTKVITTDGDGRVVDFVMNDRCAAGTGRFLEVMATSLGLTVAELGQAAGPDGGATISSMCTVFAESEVVSLLAQGVAKEKIITGLHRAVARRVRSMVKAPVTSPVVLTGGAAKNAGLRRAIATELGVEVLVPPEPQISAAVGAALIASEAEETA
ncbi:acyl-CoA dehydratase activase [Gelria sp. Kuro-4]|uniref:acyl-CoA dehydratase activase n=1 Tax=Gelria sp. Kuro-4 TaxID=2796927 RepID=UPI001BEE9EB7|nr:acyl-CoA dehydratase activase [Gelria sp. Kuro-4]BCV23905.1 2-hydroxyglutaryl-CoA dehydratase [Gelria sp. Kuro-4]